MEYNCTVEWKTLVEEVPLRKITWRESMMHKVTDQLDLLLKSDGSKVTVTVVEKAAKTPGNFISRTFSCDRYLNCEGVEKSHLWGKDKTLTMGVGPVDPWGSARSRGGITLGTKTSLRHLLSMDSSLNIPKIKFPRG